MNIFKKIITRLLTARKITKAVLVLSLIAPLAANAGVSCRGNMYGSILNTYGGYNSANYDPNYCTLGNYDTVEEVVVEGRRYTAPNWYDPITFYHMSRDQNYHRTNALLKYLMDELFGWKSRYEYDADENAHCDSNRREIEVWKLAHGNKVIDSHDIVTINWKDGTGVYRNNSGLPTSLRWTEESFKWNKNATRCRAYIKRKKHKPRFKPTGKRYYER